MARYVIDAPTPLHVVADEVLVSPRHQIVAPNRIRSEALSRLLEAVHHGALSEDLALAHHEACEIVEVHHATKLDAPSGTALATSAAMDGDVPIHPCAFQASSPTRR